MRAVLDTNVVVSAIVWGGKPKSILTKAEAGTVTLSTSDTLLAELRDVLGRAKFGPAIVASGKSVDQIVAEYEGTCSVVNAPPLPQPVAPDPDDDAVLACAVAANADAIVSGDRHLLGLGSYQGIPICKAADLLARLPP